MNFKQQVKELWQESDSPNWNYDKTLTACVDANDSFVKLHRNPAPKFRDALEDNDETYIKLWIMGCHFNWLNPR